MPLALSDDDAEDVRSYAERSSKGSQRKAADPKSSSSSVSRAPPTSSGPRASSESGGDASGSDHATDSSGSSSSEQGTVALSNSPGPTDGSDVERGLGSWTAKDGRRWMVELLKDPVGEYVVEGILRWRTHPRRGFPQYRVAWEGYRVYCNTWEPESNLPRATVRDFWSSQPGGRPAHLPAPEEYDSDDMPVGVEAPSRHASDTEDEMVEAKERQRRRRARAKRRLDIRRDKPLHGKLLAQRRQEKLEEKQREEDERLRAEKERLQRRRERAKRRRDRRADARSASSSSSSEHDGSRRDKRVRTGQGSSATPRSAVSMSEVAELKKREAMAARRRQEALRSAAAAPAKSTADIVQAARQARDASRMAAPVQGVAGSSRAAADAAGAPRPAPSAGKQPQPQPHLHPPAKTLTMLPAPTKGVAQPATKPKQTVAKPTRPAVKKAFLPLSLIASNSVKPAAAVEQAGRREAGDDRVPPTTATTAQAPAEQMTTVPRAPSPNMEKVEQARRSPLADEGQALPQHPVGSAVTAQAPSNAEGIRASLSPKMNSPSLGAGGAMAWGTAEARQVSPEAQAGGARTAQHEVDPHAAPGMFHPPRGDDGVHPHATRAAPPGARAPVLAMGNDPRLRPTRVLPMVTGHDPRLAARAKGPASTAAAGASAVPHAHPHPQPPPPPPPPPPRSPPPVLPPPPALPQQSTSARTEASAAADWERRKQDGDRILAGWGISSESELGSAIVMSYNLIPPTAEAARAETPTDAAASMPAVSVGLHRTLGRMLERLGGGRQFEMHERFYRRASTVLPSSSAAAAAGPSPQPRLIVWMPADDWRLSAAVARAKLEASVRFVCLDSDGAAAAAATAAVSPSEPQHQEAQGQALGGGVVRPTGASEATATTADPSRDLLWSGTVREVFTDRASGVVSFTVAGLLQELVELERRRRAGVASAAADDPSWPPRLAWAETVVHPWQRQLLLSACDAPGMVGCVVRRVLGDDAGASAGAGGASDGGGGGGGGAEAEVEEMVASVVLDLEEKLDALGETLDEEAARAALVWWRRRRRRRERRGGAAGDDVQRRQEQRQHAQDQGGGDTRHYDDDDDEDGAESQRIEAPRLVSDEGAEEGEHPSVRVGECVAAVDEAVEAWLQRWYWEQQRRGVDAMRRRGRGHAEEGAAGGGEDDDDDDDDGFVAALPPLCAPTPEARHCILVTGVRPRRVPTSELPTVSVVESLRPPPSSALVATTTTSTAPVLVAGHVR